MYICIYVHMYICIYVHMCIYIYIYICIYVYMCIYIYMYRCIYVYVYMYIKNACIYLCMYACKYVYMCIGVWGVDPPKREMFLPAGVFSECVREQLGRASFGSLTLFWKLVSVRPSVRTQKIEIRKSCVDIRKVVC